jgi:hypothetical protein
MHPKDTPTIVEAKQAAGVGAMLTALIETAHAEGFNINQSITRHGSVEISLNSLDDRFEAAVVDERTYGPTEVFALDVPGNGRVRYLNVRRRDIHTALRDTIGLYLEHVAAAEAPRLAVVR